MHSTNKLTLSKQSGDRLPVAERRSSIGTGTCPASGCASIRPGRKSTSRTRVTAGGPGASPSAATAHGRPSALGESLPMIARLLGHSQIQTTARYAHLARQSVKTAADTVANSLADDIGPSLRSSLAPSYPANRRIRLAPEALAELSG